MARTKKTLNVQLKSTGVMTTADGFALDAVTEDGRRVLVHIRPTQILHVRNAIHGMTRHAWFLSRIREGWAMMTGRTMDTIPGLDGI